MGGAGLPTNSTSIGNRPAIFLTRHCSRHHRPNQTRPSPVDANIFIIPTLNMKIFYTMLGAVVLAGSAAAFTRQSAPSIIRRSTTIAMASPIDFAKSEIASNDVSRARQVATMGHSCFCVQQSLLTQGWNAYFACFGVWQIHLILCTYCCYDARYIYPFPRWLSSPKHSVLSAHPRSNYSAAWMLTPRL